MTFIENFNALLPLDRHYTSMIYGLGYIDFILQKVFFTMNYKNNTL